MNSFRPFMCFYSTHFCVSQLWLPILKNITTLMCDCWIEYIYFTYIRQAFKTSVYHCRQSWFLLNVLTLLNSLSFCRPVCVVWSKTNFFNNLFYAADRVLSYWNIAISTLWNWSETWWAIHRRIWYQAPSLTIIIGVKWAPLLTPSEQHFINTQRIYQRMTCL